jgi:hypothetical protein
MNSVIIILLDNTNLKAVQGSSRGHRRFLSEPSYSEFSLSDLGIGRTGMNILAFAKILINQLQEHLMILMLMIFLEVVRRQMKLSNH